MQIVQYAYHGLNQKKQGLTLNIDAVSQLWLGRLCVGEGGRNCTSEGVALFCYAMVNRYLLHPALPRWIALAERNGINPNTNSFIKMIRMFSQPINPRWTYGGDLTAKFAGTKFVTPERLRRRDKITRLDWVDLPETVRIAVTQFAWGNYCTPDVINQTKKQRISNWASLKSTPMRYPWGFSYHGNWFFEDKALVPGTVVTTTLEI